MSDLAIPWDKKPLLRFSLVSVAFFISRVCDGTRTVLKSRGARNWNLLI